MRLRGYLRYKYRTYRWIMYYLSRTYILQCCLGLVLGIVLGSVEAVLVITLIGLVVGRRSYLLVFIFLTFGALYAHSKVGPELGVSISELEGKSGEFRMYLRQDSYMSGYQRAAIGVVEGIPGYVMARVSEYPEYIAGDILDIEGKLTIPPSFEDFDYAQFLASQEIYLQLEASETAYIGRETGFVGAMSNVRNSIRGLVSQSIPEPQSALLQGLLLGGRVELGEELEQNLRNSGTSHIVAVSGYNVTSVIIILMLIAGTVPRRVLSLGCLIALVCFLYLVGPENLPARRAVYMGLLLIGSLLAGRKSMLPLGLIYVSTLMLLENPLVWRNISFQLSVAAMVGILVFSSSIRELFKWLPSAVSEILASTLAVMLTTIPISVSTFGSISMVALPANLVILPTIPIIMLAGALGVFMMLVAPWLGSFLFWMANLGLWLVISLIEWFGSLPNAATEDTSIALTWIVSVAALYFISDYLSYEKSLE